MAWRPPFQALHSVGLDSFVSVSHTWSRRERGLTFWQQKDLQIGPTKTAPLLISTIEIRVLWMVTKHHKSAARILDRDCINRRGSVLSEEVLWVFVYQRAANIYQLSKLEVKKKFAERPGSNLLRQYQADRQNFFQTSNFDGWYLCCLWPTETHSTSLERSKSP